MLGSYQKPRHVWYIDELPKSPNGKLLKRELLDRRVPPTTETSP
jgi:acyl-coenzyme A synthetase/AMP-(fatty) acid ligase